MGARLIRDSKRCLVVIMAVLVVLIIVTAALLITRGASKAPQQRALTFDQSQIATRIPAGRFGQFDNRTPKTFQATYELVDDFDAVRVIFGSTDRSNSIVVSAVSVSTPSSAADVNNSSGEWVAATSQGNTEFGIPLAPKGAGELGMAVSDWVPLGSKPRSDAGSYPLLTVRARLAPTAALPVLGNGKDDFTNWAARADGGRRFWWRYQDGDEISRPTAFTSTRNRSQSPILGVQYLCRGHVVSVAAVGDSITEGRGQYIGEGFVLPALERFNVAGGSVKFEYANFGWSGQSPARYTRRALDLLRSEIKPDIVVLPAGSPNPVSDGALTDAAVSSLRTQRESMIATALENGVIPVVWTWLPTNSEVRRYGATDEKRVAYNLDLLANADPGLLVADTAALMTGEKRDGQVQMPAGETSDGIHPNDSGNAALEDAIAPLLMDAAHRLRNG